MFNRAHLPGPEELRPASRAAVIGLALAAGLTACGGSGEGQGQQHSSKALGAVKAAYAKTTGAETVQITLTGERKGGKSQEKQQTVTGEARLDYAENASTTTIDSPQRPSSETREIDDILYQKVPEKQRKQVPGKKPWVKIDLAKAAKAQYGDQASGAADQPPTDPAGLLLYLRGVTKASAQGTTTIDGTEATHYVAQVNLQKAVKGQGPEAAQRAQGLVQQLGKGTMSLQVWLDPQDRVRRLMSSMPAGGPKAKQTIVTTEDFSGYNESLNIDAPAKGETADVTKQVIKRQKMQQQMQKMRQKMQKQKMQQKMREQLQKQQQGQQGQQGQAPQQ